MVRLLEAAKIESALFAAEETAKHARANLALLLDSVSAAVSYWDLDLRNRFANQQAVDWFGLQGRSLQGRHAHEILGESLFEGTAPAMNAALRGETQRFARTITAEDGTRRDLAVTYTPDVRDGGVQGFVATANDVTELRATLLSSETQNALLTLAEDVAEVGHWRLESGSGHLYWSPQVYRIHGLDPATFVPTLANALDAYHPDDRQRVNDLVQRAIERQKPYAFDLRLVRADGAVRHVESRGRCGIDSATGATQAVVGVIQDITERDRLRERSAHRDRLVAAGTLASGVGHEINNPLAYVTANLEFALDELRTLAGRAPSDRMKEVLEVLVEAREGADRIAKIVRSLKAFAREDAPRAPVDVHEAVEIAIDMAVHELKSSATLFKTLEPVPPIYADPALLPQVLVSLLVNAAQSFAVRDPSRNAVSIRTRAVGSGSVAIEITDNGRGIASDVLPRIYDPFFTTKKVGQGSGLGLSTAHAIVASLGGEITCTTKVGAGTTFRVVLAAAPRSVVSALPGPPSGAARLAGKVLVVDDEPGVLRAVTRALQGELEVVAVESAGDALRLLIDENVAFDVIFCDLMLPIMTGMELHARVEAKDPALAKRFVFMTGGSASQELRRFLDEVPNERLEKPFGNERLQAIARRFVKK